MVAGRSSRAGWLWCGVAVALAINALDLGTSLIPYWIDAAHPPPPRSAVEQAIQLALLGVALAWLARLSPRMVRTLRC